MYGMTIDTKYLPTTGDVMRRTLDAAELSSADMADYLGVSRYSVSNWLNDRVRPSTQTMRLWALRTGAPYEYLVDPVCAIRDLNPEPAD